MPEWLKGADCKSAGLAYVGSNPTRPSLIKDNFLSAIFVFLICHMVTGTLPPCFLIVRTCRSLF